MALQATARRTGAGTAVDVTERIHRFSLVERMLHWTIAVTGIVCILSGLGWYSKRSFGFLLSVFGGGETARLVHGVAGIVMTVASVALIGVLWRRYVFRFIPQDWAWLKVSGGYLRRHGKPAAASETPVPAQGFFNGGQKLWAILALVLGVLFLVSGLVIWWPDLWKNFLGQQALPIDLIRWAYVVHDAAFIVFAPMVIFHIYLSTLLNPSTFEAMTSGAVTRLWALYHHPLWYAEVMGEPGGAARGSGGGSGGESAGEAMPR
ncbi:MAG: formate dehydrogenase subunit gamma [Gemmatimonadetes bacterium]|nr:formate dehydrogenase subunit gamma [Gemmatimonadota bacterium]